MKYLFFILLNTILITGFSQNVGGGIGFSQSSLFEGMEDTVLISPQNTIINSDTGLSNFFAKLNMLENKEIDLVSIYHFGDSHVEAALFPNGIAEFLQLNFGFAGREVFKEKKQTIKRKTTRRKRRADLFDENKSGLLLASSSNIHIVGFNPEYTELNKYQMPETRGIKYFSYGYSGKSFNFFSKSDKILKHIDEVKADLVIVTLGTNDVYGPNYSEEEIAREIETVIMNIRKISKDCSILLITPPDSFVKRKVSNQHLPSVRKVIIDEAIRNSIACWDFFSVMGGAGSMEDWLKNGLAGKDKIHLTKNGYIRQAQLLNYALMKEYQKYVTIRSFD